MAASDITYTYLDADGPVPKSLARNPAGTGGLKETLAVIKAAIAGCEDGSGINLSGLTFGDNEIDGNDRLLVVTVDEDDAVTGSVYATIDGIRGASGDESVALTSDETVVDSSTYTIVADDRALWSDPNGLHDHTVRCLHATPASAIAITFPIDESITSPLSEFVIIQDIEQLGNVTIEPETGGTINGGTGALTLSGPGAVVTVTVLRNDGDNPVMLAVGAIDSAAAAAGSVLSDRLRGVPPATLAAAPASLTGASTPAEQSFQTWDFDPSTIEYMDFPFVAPTWYGGEGLRLKGAFVSAATSGNVIWAASIRRCNSGEDLDTTAFDYTTNDITATVATSGTAGQPAYFSISWTNAQVDSLAGGELANLRVWRVATDVLDTVDSNDARLLEASLLLEVA